MSADASECSLIVVGAGGFGRETIELVRALQSAGQGIELVGVCDDAPAFAGTEVLGVPVLGPIASIHDHPDAQVVVTIGNPDNYGIRQQIVSRLGLDPGRYRTLIHPTAVVPKSARVGVGSIIHAQCVLTADISVGSHVAMMPSVVLTHDDQIHDFVTLGAGVLIAGGVTIHEGAYIGSGSRLREYVTVGSAALVGMGAVVTRDVPAGEVWVGSPARRIRQAASK